MIAAALPQTPATAGPGLLATSAGADPATSAFAVLLAGLLPLAAPALAVPQQPAAEIGLAAGPRPSATATAPDPADTPDASATPATPAPAGLMPAALLPAVPAPATTQAAAPAPAATGGAVPPPAGLAQASTGETPGANVLPVAGEAPAAPPVAALQRDATETQPAGSPAGADAPTPLERLPQASSPVAALVPVRGERAAATPAGSAALAAALVAAPAVEVPDPLRPAVVPTGLPPENDDPAGPSAKTLEAPPPKAGSPVATPGAPPAGVELAEAGPASDAAPDPAIDGSEVAPGRTERAASAPLAASQHAAPPPAPVQIGMQIASAASRRVERMVVQLEPAALGRVEVRLDFSHDNRVSAMIAADRPETLDILQRDSRALERSLQDAGLRLADNALSFSLRQEHRQQPRAGTGRPALPSGPLGEPGAVDDARPAQWFRAERILDIRI